MTQYIGKARYARVYDHNKDTKYEEAGVYSVEVVLEGTELERAKRDGAPLTFTQDGAILKAKRKHLVPDRKNGGVITLGPPAVVGNDGKTPFSENIGNDSLICVMGKITEFKGQKSFKLSALQVIEHVPYESGFKNYAAANGSSTEDGEETVS